MSNSIYTALTRQSGLWSEMRIVANNIANSNTTGYRSEGLIFSEFVQDLGPDSRSLSMAAARVRETSFAQGTLDQTGGTLDFAIEGDGFFLVETPDGQRLTRTGHFTTNENGDLVTPEGYAVLDAGGAPVFIPQGLGAVSVSADGTVAAGGAPVGQLGVYVPEDSTRMTRESGQIFNPQSAILPSENSRVLQGYLEQSNVEPIVQITRMIEVQRAYEMGQGFLDREDERIRNVIRSMNR